MRESIVVIVVTLHLFLYIFRLMGMVIHTAEDEFVAHVFHCEPSAGALCKVVEAACKVSQLLETLRIN